MVIKNTINILTGRVILIQKDKALFSPIFIGNIYPKGNGEELMSYLSQVYSEKHFRKYVAKFSKREYGFFESDELFSTHEIQDFTKDGVIDFNALNYETTFFADWLYLKNTGQKPVKIIFRDGKEVHLEYRDTIATRSGNAIPYPQKSILKSKDTINPIVLIEKIN